MKYYIDTCIWIDFFEDRKGHFGEPLGKYASDLFTKIANTNSTIVLSDVLLSELRKILGQVKKSLVNCRTLDVKGTQVQRNAAKRLSILRRLPPGDILHAIIARDTNSILITRDKHFNRLLDICRFYKPEELI